MRCDKTRIPAPIADPLTRTQTTMLPPAQPEMVGVDPPKRDFWPLDRQFVIVAPVRSKLEIPATDTKFDCVNFARRHAVSVIVAAEHDVPSARLWTQDSPPNNRMIRSTACGCFCLVHSLFSVLGYA
jgi:hypothetical protein